MPGAFNAALILMGVQTYVMSAYIYTHGIIAKLEYITIIVLRGNMRPVSEIIL